MQSGTVIAEYQLKCYPYLAALANEVPFQLPLISDPGVPQRFIQNGVALAEIASFPTRGGKRVQEPGLGGEHPQNARADNLAIIAFEARQVQRLMESQPPAKGFKDEALAGLEPEDFGSPLNPRLMLAEMCLDTGESQVSIAVKRKPDLVIAWVGANDGLTAAFRGILDQWALTPLEGGTFDPRKHRDEIAALQDAREFENEKGSGSDLPVLQDERIRPPALDRLQPIEFKPNLDDMVERILESGADLALVDLVDVSQIPIMFNLPALGAPALPPPQFALQFNFFGRDLGDLSDDIKLSSKKVKLQRNANGDLIEVPDGDHPTNTKVSMIALMRRLGGRAKQAIQSRGLDMGPSALLFVTDLMRMHPLIPIQEAKREAVKVLLRDEVVWQAVRGEIFDADFIFREDEVMTGVEGAAITARIGRFNEAIASAARANSDRVVVVTAADLFSDLSAGVNIPGRPRRLDTSLRGGLTSFDGVHPDGITHGLLANRLIECMWAKAFSKTTGEFGGVTWNELFSVSDEKLQELYDTEPVLPPTGGR